MQAKLPPADGDGDGAGETVADANGDVQMADGSAGEAAQKTGVDVGDTIPSVTLKNENGEDVETSGLVGERGVVLFLVPKADTRASLCMLV